MIASTTTDYIFNQLLLGLLLGLVLMWIDCYLDWRKKNMSENNLTDLRIQVKLNIQDIERQLRFNRQSLSQEEIQELTERLSQLKEQLSRITFP